ncbi:MAG: STAS domain-containing protein [Ardenticatenaceae bacterium]|nr:STAS domain-containing protein [Anaerolineales bacterium]MCB8938319.1 STAS domain-containing protein [Ardenticatenaceae bacterium]MCB8975374.1 STAS domain-containing protein [Ardenticatenaceae bacterium]
MLNVSQMNEISVLHPQGRFEAYTIGPVRNWLDEHQEVANLVVDLSGVTFLDSTALATLVQGMKHCRQRAGNLHLAGLQPSVKLIIELTRLDKAFGIYPDVETAVSAFKQSAN